LTFDILLPHRRNLPNSEALLGISVASGFYFSESEAQSFMKQVLAMLDYDDYRSH